MSLDSSRPHDYLRERTQVGATVTESKAAAHLGPAPGAARKANA